MTLSSRLSALAQSIGQDVKALSEQIGALYSATVTKLDISGATHDGVSVAYNDGGNTLAITNTDKGSTAVSNHAGLADPHPQYTTVAEAAAAAPVQSVNGQTGDVVITAPRIRPAAKGFVSSTEEQIIARWQIPANTLNNIQGKAGVLDSFVVGTGVQTAGAGTFIYRLRVGAAGTTADTQVAILTTSAAQVANAYHSIQFQGGFHGNNNAIRANGFGVLQAEVLGTITAAATTATVNPAEIIHVSITVTTSTAQIGTVIGPTLLIGGQ